MNQQLAVKQAHVFGRRGMGDFLSSEAPPWEGSPHHFGVQLSLPRIGLMLFRSIAFLWLYLLFHLPSRHAV
jgi:hypothetical protein